MKGEWQATSPETVERFTAVGYFFARELHRKLGVPIGLVNSSYGGTPVEAWMSPDSLASDPAFAVVGQRWAEALAKHSERAAAHQKATAGWTAERDAAKAAGKAFERRAPRPPQGPGHPDTPSGLYHGMIHPVLPFALRGAIWYQGESNAGRASEYRALFSAMITQWRQAFGQGDFPFYWVQLANFKTDKPDSGAWPLLREAQTQTLALPATGQAIAIDIGNPDDIHPRNKQEVGRRLALIAMSQAYGQTMDDSGPVFLRANPEKNRLRIEFAHAVTGLIARDKPLQSFEVAGADGVYRPATADIEGDTVVVRAAEVPAPVAVRYAWSNSPEANLFNGAGLPAVPFRSDVR
jgi:sialate O-acetylesterase